MNRCALPELALIVRLILGAAGLLVAVLVCALLLRR